MKRLIAIFFTISILQVNAQSVPSDTSGTWGYLPVTTGNFNTFNPYNVVGYHMQVMWKDVKPTYAGAYNWTALDAMADSAVARNKFFGIQIMVGQNSPQWVLDSCGSFRTVATAQSGPYPRYYNPKHYTYYYQFIRDILLHISQYSTARKAHFLYMQISEGSTGDGEPYKGYLDSCQILAIGGCNASDTIAHPALGDPYVPQDKFDPNWKIYKKAAWDTAAYSPGYQAMKYLKYLMLNGGNSGEDQEYLAGDSVVGYDNVDDGYIASHFSFLPLPVMGKDGQWSHYYTFWSEKASYARYDIFADSVKPKTRGEIQGYVKSTGFPHQDMFALFVGGLTAGLEMINIDQGYPPVKYAWESVATARIPDMYTYYMNTKAGGFSMPAMKVDAADTVLYPTSVYGPLIDTSKTRQFNNALYSYKQQTDESGSNKAFVEKQYWRAVNKYINPAREAAIGALYPTALKHNQTDSMHWNDYIINANYNYQKNLYQLNTAQTVIPQFRVGPDTALYGRYAGKPKLVSNKCTWFYDVDEKLVGTRENDTVQVTITYLDNNSGGSISVSCYECGQKVTKGTATTVNTNTGLFKTKTVVIPGFKFKQNGYDFMIDFTGSVTVAFVEFKNLSKQE